MVKMTLASVLNSEQLFGGGGDDDEIPLSDDYGEESDADSGAND